jgi:hypothetical protein
MTNILSPLQIKSRNKIQFESFNIGEIESHGGAIKKLFGLYSKNSISSFPRMTEAEMNVWGAYCPRKTILDKCDTPLHQGAIEILTITKEKQMFHAYEIWEEASEIIDPILVGVNLKSSYSDQSGGMKELLEGSRYENQNDYFLLCSWGESLKPYEEIRKEAFKNTLRRQTLTLRQDIKNKTRELEDLEENIRLRLAYYD